MIRKNGLSAIGLSAAPRLFDNLCASRRGQGQGQGRLHRPADRRRRGQRHRRPQLGRSRGQAAQRRSQGQIRLRAPGARRRMQAEYRRAGRHQGGRRPRDHRGGPHYCSAAAMATVEIYHRFGLPMVVWGAVLPDITYGNNYQEVHRVNGTMINQNETAAKFMTGLGFKKWAVIHDTTDYGKGHNQYFSQVRQGERRPDPRHLRRHRRPAGLHRRAHPDQGAQARGHLFRRAHADRRPHPLADGQARHQRGVRGHLRHHVRRLYRGPGPAGGRLAGFIEGAPIEKLPGGKFFRSNTQGRLQGAAGGLRRLRLRGDAADPRHDRKGRARSQEGAPTHWARSSTTTPSSARSPSTTTARTPCR